MDKKADLFSIWWLFVLATVALAIVIGVTIYYSAEINVNQSHADIVGGRIINCLVDNGEIIFDLGDETKFDLFIECNIDEEIFTNHFFANILINGDKVIFDKNYGDFAHEKDCEIIEKIPAKSPLRCVKRRESVRYNGKNVVLEIISGINQEGKKISIVE